MSCTLPEAQRVLSEILKEFDKMCGENNLRYYLFYGTLLGAVRHHGFIPWDDDVDVAMPREDYMKLMRLSVSKIPSGYFLQTPWSEKSSRFAFAKLRKDGTACIRPEQRHIKMHQGFFIDIFPLDEPAKGAIGLTWYLPRIFERLAAFSSACLPKKVAWLRPIQYVWQMIFSPAFFSRISNWVAVALNGRSGLYISAYNPERTHIRKNIWPVKCFGYPLRIDFSGIQSNIPNDSEMILEMIYGDWQQLPPEEERIAFHSVGGILETNRDYKEFIG